MSILLHKGVPKNNYTFLIEDLFHLPPVSVVHLELRISPRIFEKIPNSPDSIPGAWGKLIHKKA
jgi:hypothetical protein